MDMFKKIDDKRNWNKLLDKTLFKTFFHSLEWESFLENEFHWIRFERYVWRDELLLSIARCKLLGKEKLVSHPLCEYGGPLPLKEKVDLEGFIQDFKKQFGEKARVKFHPYIHNSPQLPLALKKGGISTFWIEGLSKKTPEDLWRGFRKTLRQEIEKSEVNKVIVEECKSVGELKHFYNLYLQTVKRHKNIPLPFSAFTFFYERPVQVLIARLGSRVIGGSVFLFYPPFIHYFINAVDYKLRSLNVGHAILWHVIQRYSEKEYDYFDLGGTRGGSPLEIFKKGWGAKAHPIYELGGNGSMTGNNLFLRTSWSLLPDSLIKIFARRVLWLKI